MVGVAVVLVAASFFRASNAPIWHLDTWSHWKYGQWIWEHGRIPEREPFSPYSDPDVRLVNNAWLSQVICSQTYTLSGMEGIALLYGLAEATKAALYLAAFRRVSGSLPLAVLGVALMQAARWKMFGVFRPEAIGEVCWAALLFACARQPLSRAAVAGVPLVLGLWANLHGGFLLGLALLGVLLAGSVTDSAACGLLAPLSPLPRGARGASGLKARRLALASVLALAATCMNPYGPNLLIETVRFGRLPVLQEVVEWQPLVPLATYTGRALVLSFLVTLATVRLSPRRFGAAEVGLLLLFGLSAWFTKRMVLWWLTVCPWVLLPHWRAILEQIKGHSESSSEFSHSVRVSSRHVIWIGVAVAVALLLASGTGRWLLRGRPRPVEEQFSEFTPVGPAQHLKDWIAQGSPQAPAPLRIFPSVVFSDYLLWELPPSARLYWYSHWHCFGPRRLADGNALLMRDGPPHDWRAVLERYRFNVLVLGAEEDAAGALFDFLLDEEHRPGSEWRILYKKPSEPQGTTGPSALVAVRRVDPFVLTLANVQGLQSCLDPLGLTPAAGSWVFLTHLPWHWAR
jgi:hypothetical protein